MTTAVLKQHGDLGLLARIDFISRRDKWHDPMFVSQFLAKSYAVPGVDPKS